MRLHKIFYALFFYIVLIISLIMICQIKLE